MEMELCDWLLVKDDVSRLTGDIGGVGLLHSECVREPGEAKEKGLNSVSLFTNLTLSIRRRSCCNKPYLCQIQWSEDNEQEGS